MISNGCFISSWYLNKLIVYTIKISYSELFNIQKLHVYIHVILQPQIFAIFNCIKLYLYRIYHDKYLLSVIRWRTFQVEVTNISKYLSHIYLHLFCGYGKVLVRIAKTLTGRGLRRKTVNSTAQKKGDEGEYMFQMVSFQREKLEERTQKNWDYLKRYRHAKQETALSQNELIQATEPSYTSSFESITSACQTRMLVRMNFPQSANGPRMRIPKELDKVKKEVKAMKEKYENLKRKYMHTIQRKRKACHSTQKLRDLPNILSSR